MIGKYKLIIILFLISLSLPLVALKIKLPEFISPKETEFISFSEPKEISIIKRQKVADVTFFDPFNFSQRKPTQEILERNNKTNKIPLALPSISFIYEGKDRYVLIEDIFFKEGDYFGEYIISQILHDRVLLKNKKGEKTWLKMENH